MIFGLVLAPAFSVLAAEPAAGNTAESGYELPPVIVIGDRMMSERELENRSKFVTIIDAREASAEATTTSEALTRTVGVRVNQWGGLGSYSTVSIRGSSPSQVQVYLDGVPVNSAVTGVTNLENFPLENVEYLEVFRGFTPADFGQSGIGGVVNLVTRKDLPVGRQVGFMYGSYDTYRSETFAGGPAGSSRYLLFAGYRQSRGDFRYLNDNGTPLNRRDDFYTTRINNDFSSADLMLHLAGGRGPWELAAVGSGHWKDQGLPGLASAQAEQTRLATSRVGLNLSARNRSLMNNRWDLRFGADGSRENQVLDDPQGELGAQGPRKTENRAEAAGVKAKAVWTPVPEALSLTGYLEYRTESYLPVSDRPERGPGKRQSRDLLATVVQVEATDPSKQWTIQLALREERYYNHLKGDPNFAWSGAAADNSRTLDLISPSVGLLYRYNDNLFLKGNAGRYFRVPSFYELFGDRGVAVGNTSLQPEQGVNFDVGFTYHGAGRGPLSRFFLEYAYFQSRTSDLILFFQNSQRTIRAANLSSAWIGGHELAFGFSLYESWRVSGNYTFQSAVDQGEVAYWLGNALPFRPVHEAYLRAEYAPGGRWRAWTDATWVSGNFWDRSNLYEVPAREIYSLGASAVVWKNQDRSVTAALEGKNLGNNRVADVAGYPLPGRSVFLTVEAKW